MNDARRNELAALAQQAADGLNLPPGCWWEGAWGKGTGLLDACPALKNLLADTPMRASFVVDDDGKAVTGG